MLDRSNNGLLTQTIANTAVDRTTAKTAKSVVDKESNASILRGNSHGVSKLMAACAELRLFPAQIGSVDGLMMNRIIETTLNYTSIGSFMISLS